MTPEEAGWVVGKLMYRDATWTEVQSDLKRWYGVELVVADSSLLPLTVSSPILTSESISTVGSKLAATFGVTATIRGDSLIIGKAGARSTR